MRKILLTLDYELYGNGSGNVFKHIIEPTERILSCVEKFGARLTVFFEVIEYWRLKEEWERGNRMGYAQNPITAMEEQLRNLYRKGHDVQLHVHPQWIDAKYEDNAWSVNLDAWRLGGFHSNDGWTIERILREGKLCIEYIIHPVDKNYKCICLRAGGYNIQPSAEIVQAMKNVGLVADTSVYPGGKETGNLSCYDYTNIPIDIGYWYCTDTLEKSVAKTTNILELPIVAFPIIRLSKYLSLDRIKSLLQNRKSARDAFDAKTSVGNAKGSIVAKFSYFFKKESQTWDFCLFSKSMHHKFLQKISKQNNRDVFVLVGHPKGFVSDGSFIYLLKQIQHKYSSITVTDLLKNSFNV